VAAPAAERAAPDTKALVLRLSDLSAGFERTGGRYVSNAQANRESSVKKDFEKLGRVNGYEAVFEKGGIAGILQITSVASRYKTAAGAHASLLVSARAAETNQEVKFRRLSVGGRLGHEARFYAATMTRNGTRIDVFSIAWRAGTIYAGVFVGALAGTADPADVVRLARKQQARISAATRS
jgi:hypothetical protein